MALLVSCGGPPTTKAKNKLHLSKNGFEFQLYQRREMKVPSDSNNVFCYIDDITGGQTLITLKAGNRMLLNESIRDGQHMAFSLDSEEYSIECVHLVNELIGNDYGTFRITCPSGKTEYVRDESDQIEALLKMIENADVTFIRNGSEYSPKEAADHLRSKWRQAGEQVKTLKSFIENIASTSSASGKPYLIKLKNGTTVAAADWYREQLKKGDLK